LAVELRLLRADSLSYAPVFKSSPRGGHGHILGGFWLSNSPSRSSGSQTENADHATDIPEHEKLSIREGFAIYDCVR
jgi:hypothetical protein